jgi:Na+/H+ antiporter NhaD/arsenite permease-like protein
VVLPQQQYIALAVFALVYALIIAGRRRFGIPIWTAMLAGAALMVVLQVVSPAGALGAINLDVIAFLFGMFSIVSALERAGVLRRMAVKMLARAKTPSQILMMFVVGMGALAAFLVNDTIALLGIPLAAHVARHARIRPAVLLMALAFGITVGSVMTPIGNPQNLLIAIGSGIEFPFATFLLYLGAPTVANLFVTYYTLRWRFRGELVAADNNNSSRPATEIAAKDADDGATSYNPRQARLAVYVTAGTLAGFVVSEVLHALGVANFGLSTVAMLGAGVLYALSPSRTQILRSVDYSVLVFFAAMFIVTTSMWQSGAISAITGWLPAPDPSDKAQSLGVITAASLALSQVLSNVPFVNLYSFQMHDAGFTGAHVQQWLMLAAASTVAGNLTILGAASNVIIVEAAETRGVRAFSFFEFARTGILVTAANVAVYLAFFFMLPGQ